MEAFVIGILLVIALGMVAVRLVLRARANWRQLEAQARMRRLQRIYHHRPVTQPRPVVQPSRINPTNKPPRPAGFSPVRPASATRRTRR